MRTPRLSRPKSARAVARRASTLPEFGRNLRDWFHELRLLTSREELARACAVRPPRRGRDFRDGGVADAFLAAQVEYLCLSAAVRPPRWVYDPCYVLRDPWFPGNPANPHLRALLIRDAPPPFLNRNLFTTPEITWQPKPGRPRLRSSAELAESNRVRQKRWRARARTAATRTPERS